MPNRKIALIDADVARRNRVYRELTQSHYVIPLDDMDEALANWPDDAIFLVYDEGQTVNKVVSAMFMAGKISSVYAYADKPRVADVAEAMRHGVCHYFEFPLDSDAFEHAVAGTEEFSAAKRMVEQQHVDSRKLLEKLSPRECEVLDLMREGMTSRDIARILVLSPRTVDMYRSLILTKLGVGNCYEAIAIAIHGRERRATCASNYAVCGGKVDAYCPPAGHA